MAAFIGNMFAQQYLKEIFLEPAKGTASSDCTGFVPRSSVLWFLLQAILVNYPSIENRCPPIVSSLCRLQLSFRPASHFLAREYRRLRRVKGNKNHAGAENCIAPNPLHSLVADKGAPGKFPRFSQIMKP